MNKRADELINNIEPLTDREKARAERADEVLRRVCDEVGIKVCSWQNLESWQNFVDGKINENQLNDRAKAELEQFSGTFGKYLVVDEGENKVSGEEAEKRDRAKQAVKIYRQACNEAGMSFCFFHNFGTWSEYVRGNMSESEFYEKAKVELEKMTSEA